LAQLLHDLKKVFGNWKYIVEVIEFQKRGLPHAHIAVKVLFTQPYITPDQIDSVVTAYIPSNPQDHLLINEFMTHHHTGENDTASSRDGCY
ncbi:hypothetical protein BS47DRAFT_1294535, partial [Hydnum rufescens UP504]